MKPVEQKVIDRGYGDCMRAVFASLLEHDIEHVPNFTLLPLDMWQEVFMKWLRCQGWVFTGTGNPWKHELLEENSFGGYFYASVPSRTYLDGSVTHAVVIDMTGTVVHDPHPNKLYQGENVLQSSALQFWYMVEPLVKAGRCSIETMVEEIDQAYLAADVEIEGMQAAKNSMPYMPWADLYWWSYIDRECRLYSEQAKE